MKREDDIVIETARIGDDILHKRVTTRTEFDEFKRHVRYKRVRQWLHVIIAGNN